MVTCFIWAPIVIIYVFEASLLSSIVLSSKSSFCIDYRLMFKHVFDLMMYLIPHIRCLPPVLPTLRHICPKKKHLSPAKTFNLPSVCVEKK